MGYERLAWIGNLVLAGIAIVLAWVPLAAQIGKWGTVVIGVLVIFAAIALFRRRRADGSTARLINGLTANVAGSHNNVQIARDHANQVIGKGRIRDSGPDSDE
jgi:hypothetical protein